MKNLISINPKDISFHPRNYNRHSEQQVEELARSLDLFDQYKNIVVWRDPGDEVLYVIAGEGLVRAALKRGLAEITVNNRSDLSEDRAMALMLADNLLPSTDFDPEKTAEICRFVDGVEEVPGVAQGWLEMVLHENKPPSLDDLADEYGKPQERDFWPMVRVQVSPETFELFNSLMEQTGIEDKAVAFEQVMGAVDATVLGSELP